MSSSDEPLFARCLQRALGVELTRRGAVLARPGARTSARLRTRVVALTDSRPTLSGERISQSAVGVRLEAWVATTDGRTLWRSSLIEVKEAVPRAEETHHSEQQRRIALERLARRAAGEIAARLELDGVR